MSTATATPNVRGAAAARASEPDVPNPSLPRAWRSLGHALVHRARAQRHKVAVADSLGTSLSYGDLLLRSLVLGRVVGRSLGPASHVGIFLPPTAGAAVANIALTLSGRIPVNLNYTTGQEVLDSCVRQCGMTHVLTSRRVLGKLKLTPKAELIYLEDIPKQVRTADKVWAALLARVVPFGLLGRFLPGLRGDRRSEPATVMFTSGSTGQPKGVVLSHGNVLANVRQIDAQVHLRPDEVVLGVLPFFHSFGFTVTIWTALCLGLKVVYHINPNDARIVGNLAQEHRATVLTASPTFLRFYMRKCPAEQFATMRLPILGAEKLQPELGAEIRAWLGVEPLEGYGCTETGPVIAVNTPDLVRAPDGREIPGHRAGTVGRPLPGTAIRTTHPDTGAELPRGAEGLVHVRGPQVMQGYLDDPQRTAEVLRDGWYNTGDIGRLDADGFLTITGRVSRFSKIGGEMVPHERVEAAVLTAAPGPDPNVVVTAVPDPKRGERLIVVHTDLGAPPEEIFRRLSEGPIPKLWLPTPEDFVRVESIPLLATGKVDLKALRQIAERHVHR